MCLQFKLDLFVKLDLFARLPQNNAQKSHRVQPLFYPESPRGGIRVRSRNVGETGSGLEKKLLPVYTTVMTRPVRIEFEGGLYHVTSRGDRQEPIYEDDEDRERFLTILGDVIESYCNPPINNRAFQ